MNVELRPAAADDIPILRRLMQLYLYDLASAEGWDISDDGTYGNAARIETFWSEADRGSFLIRADGRLAGFVLMRKGTYFSGDDAREISEFFVLRKYRRREVGRRAAVEVLEAFPGRWEVAAMEWNVEAQAFWRSVIGAYTHGAFDEFRARHGATDFVVQRFDAPAR
jgi:predicted acetyltransferase